MIHLNKCEINNVIKKIEPKLNQKEADKSLLDKKLKYPTTLT
jgi:hypothetical protein